MSHFIGCVCPTYKRPELLQEAIYAFSIQTYSRRHLIIVDDAGQIPFQREDNWNIITTVKRFPNLGAKRHFGITQLPRECTAVSCLDDDDIFLPIAVSSIAESLTKSHWSLSKIVYEINDQNQLFAVDAWNPGGTVPWYYLGSMAFTLEAYQAVGGYLNQPGPDDLPLANKLHALFGPPADSSAIKPWYIYRRNTGSPHVSDEGNDTFYDVRSAYPCKQITKLTIGWNQTNFCNLPILPGIHARPWENSPPTGG